MSKSELSTVQDAQVVAPLPQANTTIGNLLESALKGGVTNENVSVMERLMAMYKDEQESMAKREFAAAFVELQSNMPRVEAKGEVKDRAGNLMYRFARYEDIMAVMQPHLLRHGFTISFDTSVDEVGRMIQVCILTHKGGHSRNTSFGARIGKGPPNSSEAQGDGAASTYAKRFALCNALNIVIERDSDGAENDARSDGAPITEDQVLYLKELVKETGSDEAKFLKFAGSPTYEAIGSARYPSCVAALESKRK